ncbi:MAG: hydroxysqualene dehydroxylase HpnE [Candidatus Tumulicola sp.]
MAQQQRIAVVGAGLAGLAAALELKDAGAQVELFERSRLLGGRATSFEVDGCEVDNGQHVFLACCSEFIAFVRRIGMERHLHLQKRFDALVLSRDGTSGRLRASGLPAPFHLTASFMRYPHLQLGGKLRVARALATALFSGNRGPADATFEDWLTETGQDAATRRAFWDPFFIPALNAPFDRVGNADAMFVLSTAFLKDAGAARFGFSTVPLAHFAQAAAERLDAVHLSTAVVGLDVERGGVELRLLDGRIAAFDAVVLAVPPRALAKLLTDPMRYGVADLDAFEPYPIVDVHLWHGGVSIGFDFAAALESPLQWIFEKSPGYLCCSFSAADEYLALPTAQLEALAWSEVRAYLPALRNATLVRSSVTRNPEATYLPRPGVRRPSQATAVPSVAIAGAWTDTGWPDTMESAVRSGLAAARALRHAPVSPSPSRA